jgi:hypothetical protein
MAQKTAVEWLFDQIPLEWTIKGSAKKILEQAKQMEKEQIMDAYWNGTVDIDKKDALIEAEIFYKETYNK